MSVRYPLNMQRIAAIILLFAYPFYLAEAAVPSPLGDAEALYSTAVGKSSQEVIDHYERQEATTSADLFTLALAHYTRADFLQALDLANRALALQPDPKGRSTCFNLVAQCHEALGHFDPFNEG